MQTTIYYFSGTGNSFKVATDLAAHIPQSETISITRALRQDVRPAGRIGVVAPVYMFGLPLIVSDFIRQIKTGPHTYIFVVLTLGGLAGSALEQAKKEFACCGLCLSAGFLVKMPGNYTPLYEAIPPDKQRALFEQEGRKVASIAQIVGAEKTHFDRGFSLFNGLLNLVYKSGSPKIPFMDREFWAQSSCTSCGVCANVCPVNNIEMVEGKPRWKHHCQYCFACLQWCPVEAIQHGKKTAGKRRYRHPQVRIEDLINNK